MKYHIKLIMTLWLLCLAEAVCLAQDNTMQSRLNTYFGQFDLGFTLKVETCKIERVDIDSKEQILSIYVSEAFGMQPFDQEKVRRIYNDVKQLLPPPYNTYELRIYAKGVRIDELVPGGWGDDATSHRTWEDIRHRGNAWVTPTDRPYRVDKGLADRHISLWASHGSFYSQSERVWRWQRPRLYCTTEDLLSQTIVVPYLMPMLENAGAILFTPRERDWQKNEVIIDNDHPGQRGTYVEQNGQQEWSQAGTGFAQTKAVYLDGENPFTHGTTRMVATQTRRSGTASAMWVPDIPEDGPYAVYVAYTTLPTSVSDAVYTVRHRGQQTHFRVNQQMGGGTWVYLGTFDFAAGESRDNCVYLTNQSNYRGHITADAVRFGGGMGNIARGDSTNLSVSRLPRFLEGARYAAQWAGMPYELYANKNSTNDYSEDINVRSHVTNYLARGSAYAPGDSGLNVPIEMSIALHTDAGYTRDSSFIGTLGIYTTDFNDGVLPAGLSRLTSRDVCDQVVTQVNKDMLALLGNWTRRQLYDRNYSETREPTVPSIILEMLSHQNFADMRMAHDPNFKFALARAVYKGVLRSISNLHGQKNVVVQPLPVTAPMAMVAPESERIELTWLAMADTLEETAMPDGFVVYHAEGDGDFDNGTLVNEAHYELLHATRGVVHRFRITACNDGGQSMPSQEVCAYLSPTKGHRIMIIDAFDRLAAPQPFDTDSTQGFNMAADPGVPMARMPGYCGRQLCFDKTGYGREGYGGLGHSTAELEGLIIAGNTMDWTTRHLKDIIAATNGSVSVSSCTAAAVGRAVFDSRDYNVIDLVCGLNKEDGYSLRTFRAFTAPIVQALAEYTRTGGNLLVSGAYVGSDMLRESERLFTRSVLKYEYAGTLPTDSLQGITGLNMSFDISRTMNEKRYCVSSVDCLLPMTEAFCPMVYGPEGQSAAVAYKGNDYRSFVMGFPFEAITDEATRAALLQGILQFLVP